MTQDMDNIVISGLTQVRAPKQNKGGSLVIAYFDCEVRGFALRGLALVRTPKNSLTTWPPLLARRDTPVSQMVEVRITDSALRHRITIEAQAVYQAMGGKHGDWIPTYGPFSADPESERPADALPAGVLEMLDKQVGGQHA